MRRYTAQLFMLAALVVTLCAATSTAQNKPNFSGTWKLNVDKSDFGGGPKPSPYIMTIEHKEPNISSIVTIKDGVKDTSNYTTDDKEIKVPSDCCGETIFRAKWER